MSLDQIKTGDSVIHRKSGEEWVVGFVENGRLTWLGWPPGSLPVEDFAPGEACSDEESLYWIHQMAQSSVSRLSSWAKQELERRGVAAS